MRRKGRGERYIIYIYIYIYIYMCVCVCVCVRTADVLANERVKMA